jgi:hypothetical protein
MRSTCGSVVKTVAEPSLCSSQVDMTPASPPRHLVEQLQLPELDAALDREFYEETRCVIHLQLLMLTASDARLCREKILFQKFLRENRFKLMSNGISPPANVFRTSSFASIDIPLVAVWLLSLTPEALAPSCLKRTDGAYRRYRGCRGPRDACSSNGATRVLGTSRERAVPPTYAGVLGPSPAS